MFDRFKRPKAPDPGPPDPFDGKSHKRGEAPDAAAEPEALPWWKWAAASAGQTAAGAWHGTDDNEWWQGSPSKTGGFLGGALHGTDNDEWWK